MTVALAVTGVFTNRIELLGIGISVLPLIEQKQLGGSLLWSCYSLAQALKEMRVKQAYHTKVSHKARSDLPLSVVFLCLLLIRVLTERRISQPY